MDKDLKQLLRNLESLDPDKRRSAIEALTGYDSLEALEALRRTARNDTNSELRFLANKGLNILSNRLKGDSADSPPTKLTFAGSTNEKMDAIKRAAAQRFPGTSEALTTLLDEETDGRVKGTALLALGLLGDRSTIPILSRHLSDPDPNVRLNCVKALAYLDDSMVYPLFVVALNDPTPQISSRAYGFLRKLGKGKLLSLLQTMAQARHRWMRRAVALACGRLNTPKIIPILRELACREQGAIRSHALESLKTLTDLGNEQARTALNSCERTAASSLPPPTSETTESDYDGGEPLATKSAGFIIPATQHDLPLNACDASQRMTALQEIVDEGDPARIPEILARLGIEDDPKVKSALIAALGNLGGRDELPHLKKYLKHPEARIRATAVEQVGRVADEDAPALLKAFLDDPDNRIRANAIVALGRFSSVDVEPALRWLVTSSDPTHRKSAIYVLTHLEDHRYLSHLKELTHDEDGEVAVRARDALAVLTDKGIFSPSENKPAPITPQVATAEESDTISQPPPPHPSLRESQLPSRYDLDKADFFPTEQSDLAPAELLPACTFDYAAAFFFAFTLFGAIYVTHPEGWRFAIMLTVAVSIPFWLVITALSLQTGRDWARHYTLFTTRLLPIPSLSATTRRVLTNEDSLDFFDADPQRPSGIARISIVLTLCALVVFAVLFVM